MTESRPRLGQFRPHHRPSWQVLPAEWRRLALPQEWLGSNSQPAPRRAIRLALETGTVEPEQLLLGSDYLATHVVTSQTDTQYQDALWGRWGVDLSAWRALNQPDETVISHWWAYVANHYGVLPQLYQRLSTNKAGQLSRVRVHKRLDLVSEQQLVLAGELSSATRSLQLRYPTSNLGKAAGAILTNPQRLEQYQAQPGLSQVEAAILGAAWNLATTGGVQLVVAGTPPEWARMWERQQQADG